MSNTNLCVHDIKSVTTHSKCINGSWVRKITAECVNGDRVVIDLYSDGRLGLQEIADEHVRIEDYEPQIERSDKPFDLVESSAHPSASQE